MALWHCTACTAAYAVGLPACPQCSSTSHEEDPMPKIHKDRPPTYEADIEPAPEPVVEVVEVVEEAPKPGPRARGRKSKG